MCLATSAEAKMWAANWNATNDGTSNANDYEVTIEGQTLYGAQEFVNGSLVSSEGELGEDIWGPPRIGSVYDHEDQKRVDVSWRDPGPGGGWAAPGQTAHFGVVILGGNGTPGWELKNAQWTVHTDQGVVNSWPARAAGFSVTPINSTRYTIHNGTLDAMDVTNLQFRVSDTWIPLSQMVPGTGPFSLGGFGATKPSFMLPPGGSMSFDESIGTIGQYFLAKGATQVPGMPGSYSEFVHQSEIIPEPGTGTLLMLGAMVFLLCRRRR